MKKSNSLSTLLFLVLLASYNLAQSKRPMTFMDVQEMRTVTAPVVSPDGKWALYTLSTPDWKAAKRHTDIHLVSLERGVASSRQMTFTKDNNETAPQWSRDGGFFVFASDREAPAATPTQNQLYLMQPDGGEARKLTDAKDGVGNFAFSKDGKWLAYTAGKEGKRALMVMPVLPVAELDTAKPRMLALLVNEWQFAPDSKNIYFTAPETVNKDNDDRLEKKFTVRIRNEETPLIRLRVVDLDSAKTKNLAQSIAVSVSDVVISPNSRWVAFRGTPRDRYQRTMTEANIYADLFLLDAQGGTLEGLSDNKEIAESAASFSPDSQWVAFAAADNFEYFRNTRVYLRPVAGGAWKKLGDGFDGDASIGFWSADNKTIYFNEGWRATNQLFALSTDTGKVTQVTNENAVVTFSEDKDSKALIVSYSDATMPTNYFLAPQLTGNKASWRQLTDGNPQVRHFALGETEAVQWKSSDGKLIEGVLVKPVNAERGKRYPLIVQIHGGPAGADVLRFNPGYGAQIYAGAGYAVLCPNYRGSVNYGEKHKMEIGGDYFRQGYDDIMTGVDHLIAQGLVDGNQMGAMGWSAGGHWSNWILTHTDRFKAISSGAGAVNWISMYAQSDVQRNREFYYGGKPPYEDFAKYWDVSPLKFIKNAKTPTLIHVVDGDPRVPRPQSEELHMALRKLGVATEFMVYPGNTHGITEPRNQLVKAVAEFNWFEKYLRGKQGWFTWKELLKTLEEEKTNEAGLEASNSKITKP